MSDAPGADPARDHEEAEPTGGPAIRQTAFLSERLAPLRPKGEAAPAAAPEPLARSVREASLSEAGLGPIGVGESIFGPLSEAVGLEPSFRRERVRQYRVSQVQKLREAAGLREAAAAAGELPAAIAGGPPPEPPSPPPATNWVPIGPSVLRRGQAGTQPGSSGRCPGLAVAPNGTRVYAATANGGVWRSEDTGASWVPLMNAFDLNPTQAASDSLACGAIALVAGATAATDRLYVGSGEAHRGSGAMFGVGPIVSLDGGANWTTEPVSPGDPAMAGSGFYSLAVDSNNVDRVVAATPVGLYRREPDGGGGFRWDRKTLPGAPANTITGVVAADDAGSTTFYAVVSNGSVYSSTDGNTWATIGAGFPGDARVTVAVRADDPDVVYAFGQTGNVWRLDVNDGNWIAVTGLPAANNLVGTQGWYDLAIAVAPNNPNRIYLGGSTVSSGGDWSSALYRCDLTVNTSGGSITSVTAAPTYIGNSVHADVHTLVFRPGNASELWVGCDGGVFYANNATGTSATLFAARNVGLQTLTMNHLGQHPDEDAVLFCGTQDNGGDRFTGEEAWLYSAGGDCGYFVVNWDDPYRVLNTYTGASVRRSTNGGQRYSYTNVNVPVDANEAVLFYAPLVGTPHNPGTPAQAEIVAFGSIRPWVSTNFASNWQSIPNNNHTDDLVGPCRSLTFAAANKLYAGTFVGWVFIGGGVGWTQYTDGAVYRLDQSATGWTRTRIDTGVGTNLPLDGSITDIAVDAADASGNSIYITFGGIGDYRHVWHFDGTDWEQRSGPAAGSPNALLDVQHNAIVVDPSNPTHVYVGSDIGIWRSTNSGATWAPYSEALPDAAVIDLRLHQPRRLLRASTHGRGVWERRIDAASAQGVELYVRDTQLDQGRFTTENNLPDPTQPGQTVRHWRGPDIKLDTPDAMGNYQFPLTGTIDFHAFVDELTDDSLGVATHATATITTRVYVQVHNRGVTPANNVRVMALLANASAGLPALPANYWVNVQNGTPINTANWQTIGIAPLDDVRVGFPKIAAFDLSSSMLPPPASLAGNDHHCVLALLHHANDVYASTQTNTDLNSVQERKAAHKNLKVVQFTGTLPAPPPVVVPFRISNAWESDRMLSRLLLRFGGYAGRVRLVVPKLWIEGDWGEALEGFEEDQDFRIFKEWAERHLAFIEANQRSETPYNKRFSHQRVEDVRAALEAEQMFLVADPEKASVGRIVLAPASHQTLFLVFERPREGKIGEFWPMEILQIDERRGTLIGGLDLRVELVSEPDLRRHYLRLWQARRRTSTLVRAQLFDSEGTRLGPAEEAAVSLTLETDDGRVRDLGEMRWHTGWRASYASISNRLIRGRGDLTAYASYRGRTVATESITLLT